MKLRHVAAVMLTGWFLITPPPLANGHYDPSAALSKWKIEGGAGTREQCNETQAALSASAVEENRPSDIEALKNAQCVPQDDPRLQGN